MTKIISRQEQAKQILHEIGFPLHKSGYRRLCIGLPRYALDPEQSMTKELYPYIAQTLKNGGAKAVEVSIRRAIRSAWKGGNREAWQKYFPGIDKAPTNQIFIVTVSEYLE